MEHWRPVPQALIADMMMEKWSRDNQAPEAVGWLIAFDRAMAGHPISVRRLADYCGWTRWKASEVIGKVASFRADWSDYQPHVTASDRPPKPSNRSNLQGQAGQNADGNQTENGHRGRGIKGTEHEHEHGRDSNVKSGSGESSVESESAAGEAPLDGNQAPAACKGANPSVSDVWQQMEELRQKHKPGSQKRKLRGRYNDLKLRIQEHGADEVLHAWRWLWESNDKRAVYMRSTGYETGSFLRPKNLRDYVDKANDWDPEVRTVADWFGDADFDEQGNIIQLKRREQ